MRRDFTAFFMRRAKKRRRRVFRLPDAGLEQSRKGRMIRYRRCFGTAFSRRAAARKQPENVRAAAFRLPAWNSPPPLR
jgi:hypothetical protein